MVENLTGKTSGVAGGDSPPRAEVVLVVGASTGIGLATSKLLSAQGYEVIVTARDSDDLLRLAQEGFITVDLELRDEHSVQRAAVQVMNLLRGRPLKACFANAGYGLQLAFEDLTRAWLRDQFESNLFGHVQLLQSLLRYGALKSGSRIIWNSSVLGYSYLPRRGAYVASKYAMEGLANVMRLELGPQGIDIVLIEPGPIDSRFRATALSKLEQALSPTSLAEGGAYAGLVKRLSRPDGSLPGALSSEHVAQVVARVISARRVQARYRVTRNASLMAVAARILPSRWLDAVLMAAAGGERVRK